jgi:hypothetical protein
MGRCIQGGHALGRPYGIGFSHAAYFSTMVLLKKALGRLIYL